MAQRVAAETQRAHGRAAVAIQTSNPKGRSRSPSCRGSRSSATAPACHTCPLRDYELAAARTRRPRAPQTDIRRRSRHPGTKGERRKPSAPWHTPTPTPTGTDRWARASVMACSRAPSRMCSELGVERPELEGAAFECSQNQTSLAATQVHNLRTKPASKAEFVRKSGVIHRTSEGMNQPVVHRGAADNHGHQSIPRSGHCKTAARRSESRGGAETACARSPPVPSLTGSPQ